MGATTNTTLTSDRYFSRKLFCQLKGRPIMTIGEFIGNGKAKYYNPDKVIWRRREAKKYVLFGDPSLYLYGIDIHYNRPFRCNPNISNSRGNENGIVFENNLVHVSTEEYGEVEDIKLYSITGQLLSISKTNLLSIQGLTAGVYVVVVETSITHISKRIIVQ